MDELFKITHFIDKKSRDNVEYNIYGAEDKMRYSYNVLLDGQEVYNSAEHDEYYTEISATGKVAEEKSLTYL